MRRFGAVLLVAGSLLPAALARPAIAYDAAAGRAIAEKTCAACHGPAGNSQIATVPSLAGQRFRYLTLALYQLHVGHRASPQMGPIAAKLSDDEMANLAAYYAAQKPAPSHARLAPAKAAAARTLTEKLHCIECHGPKLTGEGAIPRIAGQHAAYLRVQLRGFKAGTRGDIDGNMTSAAQSLDDADIDLLAPYIAGLTSQ